MGWWQPLPRRGWDLCATSFNASRRENSVFFYGSRESRDGQSLDFLGEGYDMLDPNFRTLCAVDEKSHYLQGFIHRTGAGFLPSTISLQYLIWFQWPTNKNVWALFKTDMLNFVDIFPPKKYHQSHTDTMFFGDVILKDGLGWSILFWFGEFHGRNWYADPFLSYCYHSSLLPPKNPIIWSHYRDLTQNFTP